MKLSWSTNNPRNNGGHFFQQQTGPGYVQRGSSFTSGQQFGNRSGYVQSPFLAGNQSSQGFQQWSGSSGNFGAAGGNFQQPAQGGGSTGKVVKHGSLFIEMNDQRGWTNSNVRLMESCELILGQSEAGRQDIVIDLMSCTEIKFHDELVSIVSMEGHTVRIKATSTPQTKVWFSAIKNVVQGGLRNPPAAQPPPSRDGGHHRRGSGGGFYEGDVEKVDKAAVRLQAEVEELEERIEALTRENDDLKLELRKTRKGSTGGEVEESPAPVQPRSDEDFLDINNLPKGQILTVDFETDEIEFHERLGGGGSGAVVYRCSVKGLCFAGKVLDTSYAQKEDLDPMMKEIHIMTQLKDDHIVQYLGSQVTPDKKEVRLFTELYAGTLKDVIDKRLAQKRPFTHKEIVQFAFQIGKGILYLQSQVPPVIHRDLKSDNVFVQWDTQRNPKHLRIGDFDVSKVMDTGKITFTRAVGTPGYIAPEVLGNIGGKGKGKPYKGHDTKVDIWSYGMILYEMMTLRRPYYELRSFEVSERNQAGIRAEFPPDLDIDGLKLDKLAKLYVECTQKDPRKRPSVKKIVPILAAML